MNQLIHTSPTLVFHQLGWGIPHAMWRNHAYAFYLDSIINGNGNTKFSLAWTQDAWSMLSTSQGVRQWPKMVVDDEPCLVLSVFYHFIVIVKLKW